MSAKTISLLTQKTQVFQPSYGGTPEITQDDIAGALGFINSEGACLLGRIKFAEQNMFLSDLEKRVVKQLEWIARTEKWRIHKKGLLAGLARLAIVETINPMRCWCCKGTKHRMVNKLKVVCNICYGSGRFRLPNRSCYEAIEISKRAWQQYWRSRYYKDVLPIMDRYESIIRGALRRQLKRC